ncbi:acetate--CoA ligase family protein [bacterium]|nr:acetate--CoA ligase family protein [bacterium]
MVDRRGASCRGGRVRRARRVPGPWHRLRVVENADASGAQTGSARFYRGGSRRKSPDAARLRKNGIRHNAPARRRCRRACHEVPVLTAARTSALGALFAPRRVAVVGASADPAKIGHRVVANILYGGYAGEVIPVNPRGGTILDRPVARSIRDVEPGVDMIVVTTPAGTVTSVARECVEARAKNLVVITSGFSEIGRRGEEASLVDIARAGGARVLGPNIFGLYSAPASLNATFGPARVPKGNIAIVSQSGAIGIAMIGKAASENLGLSAIVSVGNKADLTEADLLEHFRSDPTTRAVLLYIEGLRDGERFLSAAAKVAREKPIIVLKSGWSKRGAAAAASHTGSLAGENEVFDALTSQAGILRAETLSDAFRWCAFLSSAPEPREGDGAVIVTNGGGVGVMATDASERHGVRLIDDVAMMHERFDACVPEFGSVRNPVDLTGQAVAADYRHALAAAIDEPKISSVIALFCETAVVVVDELFEIIRESNERARGVKPIVYALFGGHAMEELAARLRHAGVPAYGEVYDAVAALGALVRHARHRETPARPKPPEIDTARIGKIVAKVRRERRTALLSHEAFEVMHAIGVGVPDSALAASLDDALAHARRIGYPVALKIVSRDILHKTDAGGVLLNLDDDRELVDGYETVMHRARRAKPGARIDGVLVTRMAKPGVEVIVGARRDSVYGPVVMFGIGGIYVEVMKDVAFRGLPVTRREAAEMIGEIRGYPLLLGVRGEKRKDIPRVIDTLLRVAALIEACPEVTDVEINPIMVYAEGEGVSSVDARILVAPREKSDEGKTS